MLVVAIGPILLALFPLLPFANAGCDFWYVYGLYFNLPEQLHWSGHKRQPGRLAEVLPGYFLTNALPGIWSDYVSFLLFFTLATFFMYRTAALLMTRERAALAAIFFALSPMVIGNYAVSFSGPVITYEVLALYCAVRATRSATTKSLAGWMLLSGLAWGAGINAHLAALPFTAFIFLYVAFAIGLEPERSVRMRMGRLAVGAVSTLVGALALISALDAFAVVFWGAKGTVVLSQIYYIPKTLETNALYWRGDWFRAGPQIGVYLLGSVAAAVAIATFSARAPGAHPGPSGHSRFGLATAIAFATTMVLLVGDQLSHGLVLEYDYYYVLLWPFLALTLFSVDFSGAARIPWQAVVLFALAGFLGVAIKQYWMPAWIAEWRTAESVAIAVAALALLMLWRVARPAWVSACYLGLLVLSTLVVRPEESLWDDPNSAQPRHAYARLHTGLQFLARTFGDPHLVRPFNNARLTSQVPKFWADEADVPDAAVYPRAYLWCEYHRFPEIDPKQWARWYRRGEDFEPGDFVVVVARPPNLFARALPALHGLDLEPTTIASKTIVDEKGPYELLVLGVTRKLP